MRISDWSSDVCSSDLVFKRTDTVDLDSNAVAGFQITGRIKAHAHTGGCAGRNDIAGVKCDSARAGFDKGGQVKNKVLCLTILPKLVVDPATHSSIGRIEGVGRDQQRPHGAEGFERLAQIPLLVPTMAITCRDILEARKRGVK